MLITSEQPFLLSCDPFLLFSLLIICCHCCFLHCLPAGLALPGVFARKHLKLEELTSDQRFQGEINRAGANQADALKPRMKVTHKCSPRPSSS